MILRNFSTFILLLVIGFSGLSAQESLNFAHRFDFPNSQQDASYQESHVAVDENGNTYVLFSDLSGSAMEIAPLDPSITADWSSLDDETLLAKYGPDGELIWHHQLEYIVFAALEIGPQGDLIIAGNMPSWYPSRDIDPGLSTINVSGAFIGKYSATNGNLLDHVLIPRPITDMVVSNNQILYSAIFSSTIDVNPGSGTTNITASVVSSGNADAYICSLGPALSFNWAHPLDHELGNISNYSIRPDDFDLAVDELGNIYGLLETRIGAGINDVYLFRMDSTGGNPLWIDTLAGIPANGNASVQSASMTILDGGDVYINLRSDGTDMDPSPLNATVEEGAILARYARSNGILVSAHSFGYSVGFTILIGNGESLFYTGESSVMVDVDPGPGTFYASTSGSTTAFLLEYDSLLNAISSRRIGKAETPIDLFANRCGGFAAAFRAGTQNQQTSQILTEDLDPDSNNIVQLGVSNNTNGSVLLLRYQYNNSKTLGVSLNSNVNGCAGAINGGIGSTLSGNTSGTSYLWSNNSTTTSISGLAAGTYSLTVSNAVGCGTSASITLTDPDTVNTSVTYIDSTSCNGDSTGQAALVVTGGEPPYSFHWSSGSTDSLETSLAGGVHYVSVTDALGCVKIDTVTIAETPSLLSLSTITLSNNACFGFADGSVAALPLGGLPPYSLGWNVSSINDTIFNLAAGSYVATVTDANGCEAVDSSSVSQPTQITSMITIDDNVSCNGLSDGEASVLASGGTGLLSYLWPGSVSGTSFTGQSAGTYTVTITDANACSVLDTAVITEPTLFVASTSGITNVSCNGLNDGAVSATTAGGTGAASYVWNNNSTSASLGGLLAGSYSVTATDANGCSSLANAVISEPSALTAVTTPSDVSCNGESDGSASVVPGGGTAGYSFLWSTGATIASISNVPAGNFSVTVTDANTCTTVAQVTVFEPSALDAFILFSSDATCFGELDGTALSSANGGTGTYSYLWSNNTTTSNVSTLDAGTHTVTITDANGCADTSQVQINQPTQLSGSTTPLLQVSCFGGNNGSASVSAAGGTSGYSYSWSNNETSQTALSLSAGVSSVTITDANGCEATTTVSLTEPTNLSISSTITQTLDCYNDNNAQVVSTPSGGTFPYTFSWSNGGTSPVNAGLEDGAYTLTVTDNKGCTEVDTVQITEPDSINLGITSSNITCNGLTDGQATASGSGGTGTITYTWSNNTSGSNAMALAANTYTVTATDANGCTATDQITITEPSVITVTASVVSNVSCSGGNDGEASASGSGGTGTISYAWSNSASGSSAMTLVANTYTVTATDANGCTATDQITITEPTAVTVTASVVNNVSCNTGNDGEALASASGGTGSITYAWSNNSTASAATTLVANTYTVTATDANGCTATDQITITEPSVVTVTASVVSNVSCSGGNDGEASASGSGGTGTISYAWSNSASGSSAMTLVANTYTVTATDANGCTATDQITITEPSAVGVTASVISNVSCNGDNDGEASASGTGGTGSITYAWSNGTSGSSATTLVANTYTVTATDANGCTATDQVTVTEPTAVAVTASVISSVSCNGGNDGEATASASGGTGTITYAWSNNSSAATAANLIADTYTVTATDANGCTATNQVTVTEPTAVAVTASVISSISCNGGSDGEAAASASGGTGTITYAWSNNSSAATAANLIADTYTVTATDANGCTTTDQVTITEPDQLTLTLTSINSTCEGGDDGSIASTVTGGIEPYTYAWDNAASTSEISGLAARNFTLTITDSNGCSIQDSAMVGFDFNDPIVELGDTGILCAGFNYDLDAGNPGSLYTWSTGGDSQVESVSTSGNFWVLVEDVNGCFGSDTIEIVEDECLGVQSINQSYLDITLFPNPNIGAFSLKASRSIESAEVYIATLNGAVLEAFQWKGGTELEHRSELAAGTYLILIEHSDGKQEHLKLIVQ